MVVRGEREPEQLGEAEWKERRVAGCRRPRRLLPETAKGRIGKRGRGASSPPSALTWEPLSPRTQTHLFISYY